MAGYKVRIGASAEQDILSIFSYISATLREPSAAKRIYTAIKEKIKSLQHMPDRHGVVMEELFAQIAVRKIFVENYTIFYIINEAEKTVQVVRVLYNRREWQSLIK